MKKLLLFFLVLAQITLAQQVNVLSTEKIKATDTGGYFYPKISPDNQFMLMTRGNYSGLYQYSLADKKLKTLNEDPGAGYKVQISEDCSTVLYTKTELFANSATTHSSARPLAPAKEKCWYHLHAMLLPPEWSTPDRYM